MHMSQHETTSGWTDEAEQWLSTNYDKMSVPQIGVQLADRFGIVKSKSAIIGKAYRMGLCEKGINGVTKSSRQLFPLARLEPIVRKMAAEGCTDDVIAIAATTALNLQVTVRRVAKLIGALGIRPLPPAAPKHRKTHSGKSGSDWQTHGLKPGQSVDITEAEIVGVPFLERADRGCSWPVRDGFVCNRKQLSGLSYCDHHASKGYRQAPSPRRAAIMQAEQAEYLKVI